MDQELADFLRKVKLVSDAEAEESQYLICMRWKQGEPFMMEDNITGVCSRCWHPVQMRPTVPKRPARLCIVCASTSGGLVPN